MATDIEWCRGDDGTPGETWNPTRGCTLVSPGCSNCYAMKQAHRFSGDGQPYAGLTRLREKGGPVWTGEVRPAPMHVLEQPTRWRKPRRIFVDSMSDLFHDSVSDAHLMNVFSVMESANWHTYQILTKRADRMQAWVSEWKRKIDYMRDTPESRGYDERYKHVWLGVSVENQTYADVRIPDLLRTPAAVRFVSAEPLLTPLSLRAYMPGDGVARLVEHHNNTMHDGSGGGGEAYCDDCKLDFGPDGSTLDWVIVGGESGPGAREFNVSWAVTLRDQCKDAGVAYFMKQWGSKPVITVGHGKDEPTTIEPIRLRNRKGGDWSEWGASLRVREFPGVRHA